METSGEITVRERVRSLDQEAQRRGAPADVRLVAARSVSRRFGDDVRLQGSEFKRVSAYYWAVVRNRSLRDTQARRYVQSLVASSAVADLRASGRSDHAVFQALESGWSDSLDAEMLARARGVLCG